MTCHTEKRQEGGQRRWLDHAFGPGQGGLLRPPSYYPFTSPFGATGITLGVLPLRLGVEKKSLGHAFLDSYPAHLVVGLCCAETTLHGSKDLTEISTYRSIRVSVAGDWAVLARLCRPPESTRIVSLTKAKPKRNSVLYTTQLTRSPTTHSTPHYLFTAVLLTR